VNGIDAPVASNPGDTAAGHMVVSVPTADADESVATVLARLPGRHWDTADTVYVMDRNRRLVGTVRLTALLGLADGHRLADVAAVPPVTVAPDLDQERVASLALRHGLAEVAVVDPAGRLLGVVPAERLVEILRHEHLEDIHRLAGMRFARSALEAPAMRRLRDRLPWLLLGLAGSIVATWVVARFEDALRARVTLAFFVPGLVYLADAIGTQTEAIAVRGLSLAHTPLRRVLLGEILTGVLIGLVLGTSSGLAVLVVFADAMLALTVGVAVLVAGTIATSIGLFLPWLLAASGRDPALGSGPLATVIQDVVSLLVYFATAAVLLPG
jgi:magnesium transporter